jgi:hypothetical protein
MVNPRQLHRIILWMTATNRRGYLAGTWALSAIM